MKKMTSFVLSIVMAAFTLTSCATANSGNERTSTTTVATTKPAVTTQEATTTTVVTTAPATTTTAPATTTEEVTTTEEPLVKVSAPVDEQPMPIIDNQVTLDVTNISQYPELPMGSSLVSGAIALNYYGLNCEKTDLLQYVKLSEANDNGYWENPTETFIGDPQSYNISYGSSSVIKNAMISYLNTNGFLGYEIVDLTGSDFTKLYGEINTQNPVIIWVSILMNDLTDSFYNMYMENKESFMYSPYNQCVCLVGYNQITDTVLVCDPASEDTFLEYPRSDVEKVYDQMGKQAIVIHKQ